MNVRSKHRAVDVAPLDHALRELDRLIVDELEPGTKLPAEGALATQLGVSRLTIREALKVLAGQDLIQLRAGARATVKAPSSRALARHLDVFIRRDPRTVLELSELRHALEVQAAGLAAERAKPVALSVIDSAMQRMCTAAAAYTAGVGDEQDYHDADLAFHEALAAASGNRMLALILTSLEDAMRESFEHSFRGGNASGNSLEDRLGLHVRVAELVRARDVRGATAAMTTLLTVAELDVRASLSPSMHTVSLAQGADHSGGHSR